MTHPKLQEFMQMAYSFPQTVEHSYQTVKNILENGINGDLVECGVAMGSQIAAFQLALVEANALHRSIWAFDSFEGIPLAGEFDTERTHRGTARKFGSNST
jgi:hypothetical protein